MTRVETVLAKTVGDGHGDETVFGARDLVYQSSKKGTHSKKCNDNKTQLPMRNGTVYQRF